MSRSIAAYLAVASVLSGRRPIGFFASAQQIGFPGDIPSRIRAMTMNVYLGADLFRFNRLFNDPEDPCMVAHGGNLNAAIPCAVSEVWSNFLFTDFPSRAAVLADHINRTRPDVLGLQEVLTAYTGPFNSSVNPTDPQADEVVQDFLQILQDELSERSLPYNVASECTVFDLELPAYNDPYNATLGGFNGRIQTRTILLSSPDTTSPANADSLAFEANPTSPFPASYCAAIADVKVFHAGGLSSSGENFSYRVAAGHLITSDEAQLQSQQATELVDYLSSSGDPQIIVADINSDPRFNESVQTAYQVLTGAGYEDLWLDNRNPDASEEGYTWGHNGTLNNEVSNFTLRLDYVLYKDGGNVGRKKAWMDVFGDDPEDSRTADGKLWGSDHGAVFGDLVADAPTAPPTVAPPTSSPAVAPTAAPSEVPSEGHVGLARTVLVRFVASLMCVGMGLSVI